MYIVGVNVRKRNDSQDWEIDAWICMAYRNGEIYARRCKITTSNSKLVDKLKTQLDRELKENPNYKSCYSPR